MAKVTEVKRAAKPQSDCRGCGKKIAKGDSYRWLKKRYGPKKVCCPDCTFKASDHTGGRLGMVYDAQETACNAIAEWNREDVDDLTSTLEAFEQELETFADEYEESCENIREHFENSEKADECEEKAEQLREWQSEVESARGDIEAFEPEYPEEMDCAICKGEGTLKHQRDGKYECDGKDEEDDDCGNDHELDEDEIVDSNDQTRSQWADESSTKAEEAADNCPM
jgi:hypothetical protein